MSDDFEKNMEGLNSPADNHVAITPHDITDITKVVRAVYVGVGGDIAMVAKDDTVVVYKGAAAGSIIPFRAKRINATSTTATDLVGMY